MNIIKKNTINKQAAVVKALMGLSISLCILMVIPTQAADSSSAKPPKIPTVSIATSTPSVGVPRSILFSVGQVSQSSGEIGQRLRTLGYVDFSVSDTKEADAWSFGYRHPIGDRFSADIQYMQQGKTDLKVEASLPSGKTSAQASKDTAEAMPKLGKGVSAIVLYHHPVSSKLKFQGGIGAMAWVSRRTATVGESTYTSNRDGVSAMAQLGFSYPIIGDTWLEAYWQHTLMPDEAVDRVGLGVSVGFK